MHVCGIECMHAETLGCMYAGLGACMLVWVHVCGNGWVQRMRKLLGACMRILDACLQKRLDAKYAAVGCMYAETLGCMPDCLCFA